MRHSSWGSVISLLFLLLGCRSEVVQQEKPAVPPMADITIIDIRLLDPESLVRRLGSDIRFQEESDGHIAHFYNQTGDEILTLVGHDTEQGMSIHRFWVTRVDKKGLIRYPWLKDVARFETGKGIVLGLTPKEVEAILGEPDKRLQEDPSSEEWVYVLDDPNQSLFLNYYKQSGYYGKYTFVKGKLKWFEFGFGNLEKE